MPERPGYLDGHTDVVSDVLETMRFTTLLFGRFELAAPWAIRMPKKPSSAFYVLARGSMRLRIDGQEEPLLVSAGDVVLVPHGSAHVLDDGARKALLPRDFIPPEELRGSLSAPLRLGGDGASSLLITGCFQFSAGAHSPLLSTFPSAIHLSTNDARAAPWLASTVQLITAESSAFEQGSAIILGRLADVLLVQAFRRQAAASKGAGAGLQALADPSIGASLGLMHARLREPWTVESLAAAVGMSRSGFAARFHALVGEPPLQYLARWRMTKAAQWLRETSDSLPQIADRVGYVSAVAFNKAFKRWHGVGPGAYRRAQSMGRRDLP
ncbi:AraC family transcriptional regulator [Hyalangium gracile]|uniref:AraC family transcriptional regulator n=1 Tax=Hyalangium gracile TaxID=394092 RepID=UPI001CCCC5CB|nr:AraC family transcriptional regulator [Hyalangium gracile]